MKTNYNLTNPSELFTFIFYTFFVITLYAIQKNYYYRVTNLCSDYDYHKNRFSSMCVSVHEFNRDQNIENINVLNSFLYTIIFVIITASVVSYVSYNEKFKK